MLDTEEKLYYAMIGVGIIFALNAVASGFNLNRVIAHEDQLGMTDIAPLYRQRFWKEFKGSLFLTMSIMGLALWMQWGAWYYWIAAVIPAYIVIYALLELQLKLAQLIQ
ncbi:MAG: hypothetical protein EP297_14500 [Gammaproteobacteria bacterium]|nr:MAG: hypothetical protein EP297_14500 [Gammaproteobacteria bacterium]